MTISTSRTAGKTLLLMRNIAKVFETEAMETHALKGINLEIKEGDYLVFKNAGAYCFTMSSNYNSRFRPAEVLWHNNRAHTIRKQETLDDLISNQILIDFSEKDEIN